MDLKKEDLHLFMEAIIDEIDVGLHVINKKGHTILYNKKMMQIESMDSRDVMNKNLLDVFMFSKDGDSTLVQALQNGTETKNIKQTYFNNKGKEITTVNNTFPIRDGEEIVGAVEIAKDITKIERLMKDTIKRKGGTRYTFESIIGEGPAIKEVIESAKRATRTASSVLIVGETGTGKELFAQSIHNGSSRSAAPFISQNCAALPDSLIESLLFGTKKGAFSGAIDHPGLFEQAEGGTLLLDEINSLNPHLQSKLLRALQERTIRRIGDTKDTPIDVRIIATINEDPIEAITKERMRKDLYYRLSVVTIFVPPLRDRTEDIPLLIERFISKYNELFQMDVQRVDQEVLETLHTYEWPGNVRELQHMIEGAMNLMADEETIRFNHLPMHFRSKSKVQTASSAQEQLYEETIESFKLKEHMDRSEAHYIKVMLKKNGYNISKTAEEAGLSRQSLQYRMKKLNIEARKEKSF
ncbi:sigma 54-interacting transcriptional regulator [Bacillus sp. F19]|nr:sigma 54-interacting transcriptional regulator [Bacillus sp. F19]